MLLARTTLLIVTLTPGAAARTGGTSPHMIAAKTSLLSTRYTGEPRAAPTRRAPVSPTVPNTTLPGGARPAKCRPKSRIFALVPGRRKGPSARPGPVGCAGPAGWLLITRCHGNIDLLGDSIFSIGA